MVKQNFAHGTDGTQPSLPMTRCAILDDYQGMALSLADWSGLGLSITVHRQHYETPQAVAHAIADDEIVVAMRERTVFDRHQLSLLPKLKLLLSSGARNPAIDLHAAADLGITVIGSDSKAYPTAELTWGLIHALMRDIPGEDARLRRGDEPWQTKVGKDLHGRTLGVFGLGTLGLQVTRVAQAFGMHTLAWSNNLTPEACAAAGVEYVSKQDLLRRSDILSIHTQLSRRTEGAIGAAELALMKPTAYLINTSRAQIVDEAALVQSLESGRIAGAALDVYAAEPLPMDHRLRRTPNTLLTPHIGYVTEDNYRFWFGQLVESLHAWRRGEILRPMNPATNVDRSK
jgi:D-3-phosphoglycerate dehydrogenase